jgi:hypothetical protein
MSNEDRERDRLLVEQEAAAFAAANGMIRDDENDQRRVAPNPAELLALHGGDVETLSRSVQNQPVVGGVRVTTFEEQDAQKALMESFWARGGGRFPAHLQPPDVKPPAPRHVDERFIRESLQDGYTWA